jgi:hypothetical protein
MFPSRQGSVTHQFEIDSFGLFGPVAGISNTYASAVFPTANKVLYIPIRIPSPVLIQQLYIINGAAVSGNVDMGVYSRDGTKLISSGSTAQAGVSVKQQFNVTDTLIGRGVYYLAVTLDNIVGTLTRAAPAIATLQSMGLLKETPGGFGLPANATFGTYADAYYPACGILAQSVM